MKSFIHLTVTFACGVVVGMSVMFVMAFREKIEYPSIPEGKILVFIASFKTVVALQDESGETTLHRWNEEKLPYMFKIENGVIETFGVRKHYP